MKKFKSLLLILLLIPCMFLCGCSLSNSSVYVTNIEQTNTEGTTVTYTVTYSNGTTSNIVVENGTDGQNGENLTIEAIKQYCEENGEDFEEFLAKYLDINYNATKYATNKALQSAVSIFAVSPYKTYDVEKYCTISAGAGVIYQMDTAENGYSYVVTNYHVVYSTTTEDNIAEDIRLFQYGIDDVVGYKDNPIQGVYSEYQFFDGAIECTYIGGSMNYDIAVLKVPTAELIKYNPTATAVTLASDYSVAETAIAIGNPEGSGISATSGIISVESETINMYGADDRTLINFRVMRIDTAVNGGNSGGGLFNINGELIGIVNAKITYSSIENIAYALPVDNISKVANNLIHYYETTNQTANGVKYINLNIDTEAKNSKQIYDATNNTTKIVDDCVVTSVGIGVCNGKLLAGDVIKAVKINNTLYEIEQTYQFDEILLNVKRNDELLIKFQRGDNAEIQTVSIDTNGIFITKN